MPPQLALADAAFDGEQQLAQTLGVSSDHLGLLRMGRVSRRVEHALFHRQHDGSGALDTDVAAQQRLGPQVTDLDAVLEHAHQHMAADGRRPCGIAAVIDAHAAVVAAIGEALFPSTARLLTGAGISQIS